MSESVHCDYFEQERCRSCSWIDRGYAEQLAAKQATAQQLLGGIDSGIDWQPPQASATRGFRNKAKLVVSGDCAQPVLGIVDERYQGIDLSDCLLYPESMRAALPRLRQFISLARLLPYDIAARQGELKYLLLTASPADHAMMLRFVLRSREALGRIEKHLPELQSALPALRVVSVNLQPRHAAVLEGDTEILLSAEDSLPMPLNGVPLYLQPGGFFQTNSAVAAALYQSARRWIEPMQPRRVLDLYCGVGGFALHLAAAGREVSGVEISPSAIASARRAAAEAGIQARFDCADARVLPATSAELVVVNPPRRGLGNELCNALQASRARWLLYSSCNPDSLARDLRLLPHFRLRRAQLFDMFPHTPHAELLVLLQRAG